MNAARHLFRVDRRDIHYIRTTLESYDGMAVVSTVAASEGRIEISVAPGCEGEIAALVSALRDREGVPMERMTAASHDLGSVGDETDKDKV